MRFFALILSICLLTGNAFATWSIIVVNTVTKEIVVASATCIEYANLRAIIGILNGQGGAGAAQSIGASILMRQDIHQMLENGVPPEEILQTMASYDSLHELRQYGLVDVAGRAVSFTGNNCYGWAGGVTGKSGDFAYAIQGNILTGEAVVNAAEQALLNTPGDLLQKVMSAMEAARDMGGDGRCSCSVYRPTDCGAPPWDTVPAVRYPQSNGVSKKKSAHIGFLVSVRPGDEPYCSSNSCATGQVYFAINKAGLGKPDPDVVNEMRTKFDALRLALQGRPDAYLSNVQTDSHEVFTNNTAPVSFVLNLADVDGNLLTTGGANISMSHDPRSSGLATLHQIFDNNDGTYTVEVLPGDSTGVDLLQFTVDDGVSPVQLWPPTTLIHREPLTPTQSPELISGLQNINVTFARPSKDGLKIWVVGDRGSGKELLEYRRQNWQDSFSPSMSWGIQNFPMDNLRSFWISEDSLRLTLAAKKSGSFQQNLYQTQRVSTLNDFEEPTLISDLSTKGIEGAPFLAANELELWFHSNRSGKFEIWHSARKHSNARWYPPKKYTPNDKSKSNSYPTFINNETELLFTRLLPNSSGYIIRKAQRNEKFNITNEGPLIGILQDKSILNIPVGFIKDSSSSKRGVLSLANGQLLLSTLSDGALTTNISSVSVANGGTFIFSINSGPNFGGAQYKLLAGELRPRVTKFGILPISFSQSFSSKVMNVLGQANGQLNASGEATSTLTISPNMAFPPTLFNQNIYLSYFASTGNNYFISNEVAIQVEP